MTPDIDTLYAAKKFNRKKVGLVGYGTGGSLFHAPFIEASPHLELTGIVTTSSDRRKAAGELYPQVAFFDSLTDMLAKDKPDMVSITTTNETHAALAIEALNAGVDVVIDKPFALSVESASEIYAAADKNGRWVAPYQNRRYDSDFLTLQKQIREKSLGKLIRLESSIERYRREPKVGGWRETTTSGGGGGVLLDLGSHLIDQMVALFGVDIRLVYARAERVRGLPAEDDVTLILQAGETEMVLRASMVSGLSAPRFRVLGFDRSWLCEQGDIQEDQLRGGLKPDDENFGVEQNPAISERGAWLNYWTKAALHGPPVPRQEVLRVLAIIEEARSLAFVHQSG